MYLTFNPPFEHDNINASINQQIQILITATAPRRAKSRQNDSEQLNHLIVEGIRDKKGKNIVQLDLRKLGDAPADFFIFCEGDSNTHVKAISDSIYKKVKEEMHTMPSHTEGLLKHRLVHVIATDAHDAENRPPLLSRAVTEAAALTGSRSFAISLVEDIRAKILAGEPVEILEPVRVRERR